MQAARALLFSLIFYPGTALFAAAGLAAGLASQSAMRAVVHGWARFHHWLAADVLGIRTVIDGDIPRGPYLIAVKHQSMFETIEMLRIADGPIVSHGSSPAFSERAPSHGRAEDALRPACAIWMPNFAVPMRLQCAITRVMPASQASE